MRTRTGSKEYDTYNKLQIDGLYVVSVWGKIQTMEKREGGYFVSIGKCDAFFHNIDEVILDEDKNEHS